MQVNSQYVGFGGKRMQMAIKVDVQWVVDYAEAADALLPGRRARDAQPAPIAIALAISNTLGIGRLLARPGVPDELLESRPVHWLAGSQGPHWSARY
jgi:hypothetical protein